MMLAAMPRKRTTVTIDVEALNAFRRLAKKSNMSFPKFLEVCMIDIAKSKGEIDKDYETLGETRGGDRYQEEALEQ
jgi:hypothetical protein